MKGRTMENTKVEANGWLTGLAVPGLDQVVGLARAGVHLGLGLAAMTVDAAQGLASEAIRRGAEVERTGTERLASAEREAVQHMKDYVRASRDRQGGDEASLEARIEQSLATYDVPTKDDIRELHMHLAAVSDKLNSLQRG
jgi:polyhydroxyalkanoate synthesis regulator phasin